MRMLGQDSPFTRTERMCRCHRYTPFIPPHALSLSLHHVSTHHVSLSTPHGWKRLRGSSGRAQTPVARCVDLTQYWHKGGRGAWVCAGHTHINEMSYSHQRFFLVQNVLLPSPPPPLLVCPATCLTFVPALISKKAHCKVATCWLNLSHSVPVRASFP